MSDVELLPCSQCGESKGYRLGEGSTYRWWVVFCSACDAEFGECGADRATNLHKDPLPDRWHWADEHWNDCNKHAHGLRQRITELEALLKARDEECEALRESHDSLLEFCRTEIRKLPPEYRKQKMAIDYGPNEE